MLPNTPNHPDSHRFQSQKGAPRATRLLGLATALALLMLIATSAVAQSGLTPMTDEQIKARVAELSPQIGSTPGASSAAGVVLLNRTYLDVKVGKQLRLREVILSVNDVTGLDDYFDAMYQDAQAVVKKAGSYQLRGDKLTHSPDADVLVIKGDARVKRPRIDVDFPDLKNGDVVGWWILMEIDHPIYTALIPAADRLPVVAAELEMITDGRNTYQIFPHALDDHDFQTKALGQTRSRDSHWTASAGQLGAVPGLPKDGPFSSTDPIFMIGQTATYLMTPSEGWSSTLNWVRLAVWISGLREGGLAELVGVANYSEKILGGASGAVDQERAAFEKLRDDVPLLQGDAYDHLGWRTLPEVLDSGKASALEKCMLMIGLLDAVGVDAQLSVVRMEEWGKIHMDFASFGQFQRVAVRCGPAGSSARWYVPYHPDAQPGKLPSSWGKCTLFTPAPNLMMSSQGALIEIMNRGVTDRKQIGEEIQNIAKRDKWYRFENAGG